MIFCLLQDSPPINVQEQREIDQNLGGVAHRGRDPSLYLMRQGREIRLRQWARELCQAIAVICELLDENDPDHPYSDALRVQRERIEDPDRTPSAMMLAEMRREGEGFYHFAKRLSLQHNSYFGDLRQSPERVDFFRKQAELSLKRQAVVEAEPQPPFDQFLEAYFAQK